MLPYEKSIVIPNGVEVFPRVEKTNGIIKLIYASTPFRGLDILLAAYSMMLDRSADLRGEVHLDVFSNMSLYGSPYEAQNSVYEGMYEFAKLHPAITYHGAVERPVLREYMLDANILAYSNTWEETSCCVAIEAMAAGVLPVVSNIGALPETCSVYAKYYSPMSTDMYNKMKKHNHALQYSYVLEKEIRNYMEKIPTEHISKMIDFAEYGHSWDNVIPLWTELFSVF
jgi:glycosyltransferase involved in cell wall biosynthesis